MKKQTSVFILCFLSFQIFSQWTIDNRPFQTPVKDQSQRGTCSAFGVAAALEVLPGVPADISEQYLYGALKISQSGKGFQEGDDLINFIPSLKKYGFIHEEEMVYNSKRIAWEKAGDDFTQLMQGSQTGAVGLFMLSDYAKYTINDFSYTFFNAQESRDPGVLKQLLRNGHKAIAVAYIRLHGPRWAAANPTTQNPIEPSIQVEVDGALYPYATAKLRYQNGNLMDDIMNEKVNIAFEDPYRINPNTGKEIPNYGGHVVTVVGYNDKGFIFKNSWGEDWGDGGYGFISYDAHKLMVDEMLLFKSVVYVKPKSTFSLSRKTDVRLKSTLSKIGNRNEYQLSIFTKDRGSDPSLSTVRYKVYDQNGRLIDEKVALSGMFSGSYQNTFAVSLFNTMKTFPKLMILKGEEAMKVVVELSDGKTKVTKSFFNVYFKTNEYKALNISAYLKE